ncbi:MAG: VWA domain-containing protein [Myxococcaceae bacterium]
MKTNPARLALFALAAVVAVGCSYSAYPHPRAMLEVEPSEAPLPADANRERYEFISEQPFLAVTDQPLSTFSIDVDTASYANVRRFLSQGERPPKDSVRIEELLNTFPFAYPAPTDDAPFGVHAEVFTCPWAPEHRLLKLGLKAREVELKDRPRANLVFLLDVSGSMDAPNKLPLLKSAFKLLASRLRADDTVAIVVYAGASGLVLPPTRGNDEARIANALDQLMAGGSTHGSSGIELAYRTAEEHFVKGGINRVILATDGDWNVGTTSDGALIRLVEEKAKSGVALTVLGFGMGNYNDSMLEKLADHGNGNYAYIDNLNEARRVLVEQASGTLLTLAKDVKLQVEFNPARVGAYRLIGYEDRALRTRDFNDDQKDAGELGAGHNVTALYELIPAGRAEVPLVEPLRYQQQGSAVPSTELAAVKVRFKAPEATTSQLRRYVVSDEGHSLAQASSEARFAAAVAEFGLLLRDSAFKGKASYEDVLALATPAANTQARQEFLDLTKRAAQLAH